MGTLHLEAEQLPFNLDLTLACGQVFRWERAGSGWTGIVRGRVVTISQDGPILSYEGIEKEDLIRYFNLDINIKDVLGSIRISIHERSKRIDDPFFEFAVEVGAGLRIIRQDPWECLISFICSQNSNIPAITKRISLICERYGRSLGDNRFSFPKPNDLVMPELDELRRCCTGYRAPYLAETSKFLLKEPDFLDRIAYLPMEKGKEELMKLPGVGPKVADCVLLFAYNMYQAVPVDVWIRSIITKAYPEVQNRKCNRKECSYNDIAEFCREYFGCYAGYAQQFFFASRLKLPFE